MRRRIGDVSAKHRSRQGVRTGRYRVEQGRGGHRGEQGSAEPGVAQRQAAEVSKQQDNRSDVSTEAYKFLRQWSTVETAPTENTSVHGHDSDLGSSRGEKRSFQCTRLPSYRRACKKVRLKHGQDRERTSACVTAGYSRDSILPSARPTLIPKGKEKRQSSRARALTGHKKRRKATICEGVYTNTWRVVEGIMARKTGTQTEASTQAQRKKITYNMYIQQHVKGYTQTH